MSSRLLDAGGGKRDPGADDECYTVKGMVAMYHQSLHCTVMGGKAVETKKPTVL